jgi:hypothetical protein
MAEAVVQIMNIIECLSEWSTKAIESVTETHSPNLHVDEVEQLLVPSWRPGGLTIGDLIEIHFDLTARVHIDHAKFRLSLGIPLEDRKTPRPIKSLESVRHRLVDSFYSPPFFQISLRSLDMLTDFDEVYRFPVVVEKNRDLGLRMVVLFEARIRTSDLEDGDHSFTRALIVEPVVERI